MRVEELSNVSNEQAPNCMRFRVQGLGFRVQGFIGAKNRSVPNLPYLIMQPPIHRTTATGRQAWKLGLAGARRAKF